jgi:peptidoglycan/xylan/chitin deacetylase (PgdA/CDA1 family)
VIAKISAAVAVLIIGLGATLLWSYSETVSSFPGAEKVVVLTYDDGPNPPHTRDLLAVLEEYGVKATFFLKGRNVEAYPEAAREIALAGHEIANHSFYHRSLLTVGKFDAMEELRRSNLLIEESTGIAPQLFRPPYGAQGIGLKLALEELDMVSVLMSAHGSDWEVTDAQLIADAVLENIEPGAIVLLHDGHGDVDDPAAQSSRAATVAATSIIIESLKAKGYRFATVGEMLSASR